MIITKIFIIFFISLHIVNINGLNNNSDLVIEEKNNVLFETTWISNNKSDNYTIMEEKESTIGLLKYERNNKKISIVSCTNHIENIHNILTNFKTQTYPNLELLILVDGGGYQYHNKKEVKHQIKKIAHKTLHEKIKKITKFKNNVYRYKKIRIQNMKDISLGSCLNYGISRTNGILIMKWDDSDFYGKNYITNIYSKYQENNANILIKLTHFSYLESKDATYLLSPGHENQFIHSCTLPHTRVPGSTICIERKALQKYNLHFKDITAGEDTDFLCRAIKKGISIYSTSRYDHCWKRSSLKTKHTWKINDIDLIKITKAIKQFDGFDPLKISSPS